MADGTIQIDVILDDGSVKKGIANLDGLSNSGKKAGTSIGSMVKAMGLVKIASSAFNVLKNSLDGAISRFDTMQKFPKVMKALGFSAEDSEKSITKLSDGIEGLPTKLDDVVSSTQQMTSITGDLDKSTDTVLALNNAFLASGSSADDASRGTQQYMQMLSSGTVDLESWKTLQETMPLALQKTAEAMGFVGKSAQRDLYAALKDGTVTFEDFQDQLIDLGTGTGDLAGLAKENSLGIATSFGNLRNAVAKNVANMITKFDEITQKLTGKTIAENIDSLKVIINSSFKSMTDSMDQIVPIIESLSSTFGNLKMIIQPLAPLMFGLIAAFVTFQTLSSISATIKTVTTSLNAFKKAQKAATLGQAALNAVMAINPYILIATAVIGLVAAIVYLWNTNEGFRTALIATWQAILTFIQPAITAISNVIMSVWTTLLAWWNENQNMIKSTVTTVWTAIQSIFNNVINLIVGIVQFGLNRIKSFWDVWGESIKVIAQVVWAFISNVFNLYLKNILSIVSSVIRQIQNIFKFAMNFIGGIVDVVLSAMKGDWDGVLKGIQRIVSAFGTYITDTFDNLMSLAGDLVSNGIGAISGFFDDLWNIDLSAAGKAIIDGFLGGLKSAYEGVKDFVGGIAGWIADHKGPLTYDARLLIPAGNAIMGGLDESLKDRFNSVQRNIRSMADRLKVGFEMGAESNFSRALPVTTAEQALGRNISGNSYSTNNQTVNNYGGNGSDTETIQLLKQIRDKTNDIILDGTSVVKKLGTKIDENQGSRTSYAEWGLELNG
ncbi:tape measure protein [Marinilactibacillus psychrotolerans]|uniref:tape measure protein n=1 Tax=Marinilactibacillus psychrotolerans TaxID=191770 RepID=UPI0038838B88